MMTPAVRVNAARARAASSSRFTCVSTGRPPGSSRSSIHRSGRARTGPRDWSGCGRIRSAPGRTGTAKRSSRPPSLPILRSARRRELAEPRLELSPRMQALLAIGTAREVIAERGSAGLLEIAVAECRKIPAAKPLDLGLERGDPQCIGGTLAVALLPCCVPEGARLALVHADVGSLAEIAELGLDLVGLLVERAAELVALGGHELERELRCLGGLRRRGHRPAPFLRDRCLR